MRNNPLIPKSKLPNLGTTIFTQMSALAQKHQAINLSQGFPDFDGPRYLHERLAYHVAQGANQYAPMTGAQALREAIADKTAEIYGYRPDDVSDITVTAGATEALYAAITALVRAGDEVICFDPSYDSYAPAVALSGGVLKRIALTPPHFRVDWQVFSALLSERTRLVILNTPHNPTATVWRQADIEALWQAIGEREIYVLSDEVYEHICFAAEGHASVLAHPQLRERAVAVSSFGKTFHMTGWKIGYCVAPAAISAEIRKVHQYLTFCVNTPAQLALADMLRAAPEHYRALPDFYRKKRDVLVNALAQSRLKVLPCEGTYFLLIDYSAVSTLNDVEFCQWLTEEVGVAAIPLSVFCAAPFPHQLIRLCFAKQESTLLAAAERLCKL
ncbi:TPA_asm: pyridoxal phosphate-dependent aminotransferase [Salmonella enterica subsp. enterica serovar Typhimurium]|uniref:Pyridoxal phosphate-dependent aminotransferase n=1 Tax=Salmonella typhimurium TaxID=90371 RepID=A0A710H071_SALTM|nr:pyridoxal phosphate-dependent aminotransferase [Salmonella enterica subsp. enterica serovar Typhimurium]EHX7010926.1 pyridoxal phosphate-dependent aminotransferase [Salmonella enterica subsp. enterica serovar Concord]ECJ8059971.1 pyridoxal phosphate-dependent aminotransferase [Salmonella enterica subsp. enterica serovar Typhimurium]EDD0511568.1 aminotransferase class I/II-fold pyridoxal phosphate-dependent enzyme [Salmonella enterica subsp. enterica serovar Typhimurium]HAD1602414.1 pyridoxal